MQSIQPILMAYVQGEKRGGEGFKNKGYDPACTMAAKSTLSLLTHSSFTLPTEKHPQSSLSLPAHNTPTPTDLPVRGAPGRLLLHSQHHLLFLTAMHYRVPHFATAENKRIIGFGC